MSESIVYKNTPLGEYLEGIFLLMMGIIVGTGTYEADWGVSDRGSSEDEGVSNYAPPSRVPRRRFTTNELKPLMIVNETVSRTAKFYNLFSVFCLLPLVDVDFILAACASSTDRSIPRATTIYHMHL